MASYVKQSRLESEAVLRAAREFFGPGGLGLAEKGAEPGCTTFEGGGGHVSIEVCPRDGMTEVNILTQEWDYQVQDFLRRI